MSRTPLNGSAVRWITDTLRGKRWYILLLTVLQALQGSSGVLYALLMRNMVDSAVTGSSGAFRRNVVLTAALMTGQLALWAVIRWLNELSRTDYENLFKKKLLGNIMRRDFSRVSAVHSGEWLNRLTSDTAVIANSCVEIVPGMAGMTVKMLSALVMMAALDLRFAAIIVPSGAVMILLTVLLRKRMKALHRTVQEKDGRLRIFMQERIGSLMMIRSFAAESRTSDEAADRMEEHKAARMARLRFSNLCSTGFGAAMNGMYLFGAAYCGYGILKGRITFGTLTAITQLIAQIQSPVASITGYLPRFYSMTASAERIMEAEKFPEDCAPAKDTPEVRRFYDSSFAGVGLDCADFAYYPPSGGLNGLSKSQMPVVLSGLSLLIRRGEYVAVTGRSGCGKSTMLKLLMSVYRPDSGSCYVLLSDGSRVPMSPELRRLFAYVPQGNHLMSGSVREAVSFGSEPDEKRLHDALRIACAESFVSALEKGADTLLGERGAGLSEGQLQRLAIARAVYSGSPVLLLDEATSALDGLSERQLLENLRTLTDMTVIIVTHRRAALEICDRVLEISVNGVMEK